MSKQAEQAARPVWKYGEPIQAVVFFAPGDPCGNRRGPDVRRSASTATAAVPLG